MNQKVVIIAAFNFSNSSSFKSPLRRKSPRFRKFPMAVDAAVLGLDEIAGPRGAGGASIFEASLFFGTVGAAGCMPIGFARGV